MSRLKEGNTEQDDHGGGFKWGAEKGVGRKNKDVVFYESFTFEGEEYFVDDCVYFERREPEAYIGKIVKMFEGANHVKRVKVVWFLRPSEIRNYFGNYEPRWNEIFLASGKGPGVSNINLVEAIGGKCYVVCSSNDHRNPQASEADLSGADYFFRCHFDVGECFISDVFPDLINGVEVERFFNKKRKQRPPGPVNLKLNVKEKTEVPNYSSKLKERRAIGHIAKDDNSSSKLNPLFKEPKTVPVGMSKQPHLPNGNTLLRLRTSVPDGGAKNGGSSCYQVQYKVDKAVEVSLISTDEVQPYKKRKLLQDEMASSKFDNQDCQQRQDRDINIDNQLERRKLFPDEMASSKFDNQGCQQLQDRSINIDNQLVQRKLLPDEMVSSKFDNQGCQQRQDRGSNIYNQLVQRKLLPDEMSRGKFDNQRKLANHNLPFRSLQDRRSWFKQLPWEERLEKAQEAGTLVSLENLDASFSSKEVEDLLWDAFKEKVEAKMIAERTFSCPYYGKALIIFNSKEAAFSTISQLMTRCLMLADGRPLIARKATFRKPVKLAGFVGHLTIDKGHLQRQNLEKRRAKSTSHAAQPNNMESEMAMQWRILQEKSDLFWKTLHERQAKEIQDVTKQLKQLKMKSSS